ncbi:MAG: hypothetical protein SAJ12_10470 [Jaaginema sp. PMC 1079.18]|nr:hypothetical protein [Jaaginema sp. PMC 1080.18]MEC4851425.1 hypothetical protein [Jaaginema sp. PMC 1079.18]MEC4866104.1 hypothetical protein [Jaaginema sp. PMC 1078.18]
MCITDEPDEKTNHQRNRPSHPRRMGELGEASFRDGDCQPDATVSYDCERRSGDEENNHSGTEGVVGGILGHLRLMQQACLRYVDEHAGRLEARLKENHAFRDQLVGSMKNLEDDVACLLESQEQDDNDN